MLHNKTANLVGLAKVVKGGLKRAGFAGGSNSCEDGAMTGKTTNKFSPCPCGSDGSGSRERATLALGGGDLDCGQDRLYAADAA